MLIRFSPQHSESSNQAVPKLCSEQPQHLLDGQDGPRFENPALHSREMMTNGVTVNLQTSSVELQLILYSETGLNSTWTNRNVFRRKPCLTC